MGGIISSSSTARATRARAASRATAHHPLADIDAQEFSDGYTIGAAICAVLLLIEIIVVKALLS
jgi:hypothetical protein